MPKISALGGMSSRGFGEFAQQNSAAYIEDVFSTYLYTGTGASQTIINNIGLSDTASWSSYALRGSGTETLGYGVTTDSSGNFYLCASDQGDSYSGTRYAAVTAKYNSAGTLQWQRIAYSSTGNNIGSGVTVDSTGNVYSIFQNNGSGNIFNIRKYDSSGSLQWQRNLGGGAGINTFPKAIGVDSSGNVYAVGRSPQYSGDVNSMIVAKYDSSGTIQWQKYIKQSSFGQGEDLSVDGSGNIYVVGTTNDGSYNYALLIKLDSTGAITWQRKLRHNAYEAYGYSVATDSSGNVYLGGAANDAGGTYALIAKYDSSGTLQWQRFFYDGLTSGGVVYGVYVNSAGDVHIAALITKSPSYVAVAKYNSSGTLQWQRAFPNISTLPNNCLSGDLSGNLYLNLSGFNGTTQTIVKIKSDGTTTSGYALATMIVGSATSANGSLTSSTSTATNNSSTLTTATGAITDYAGGLTSTSYTQDAVSGAGGLVWMKSRSAVTDHALYDTARGATFDLVSNSTAAQTTQTTGLTAFSASGFSIGALAKINTNAATYASWTFRKQPKFFDCVTYTGDGTNNRLIAHSLGSVPGMVIVKCTSAAAAWPVWHNSLGGSNYNMYLNTSGVNGAQGDFSSTGSVSFSSTSFPVSNGGLANTSGQTYVAYLFAHNAGGFGADGSQNAISCGSFTTDGSGNATVTLGYEPQYVLLKRTNAAENWTVVDSMRGFNLTNTLALQPNVSDADLSLGTLLRPSSTGFTVSSFGASNTYIYMAIRRGPMKTPIDATKVFAPTTTATAASPGATATTGFPVDLSIYALRNLGGLNSIFFDRLRGSTSTSSRRLVSSGTAAEASSSSNGIGLQSNTTVTDNWTGAAGYNNILWNFGRAPGFFDVVCYTGNSTAALVNQTINHNLGVVPELIIVKGRSTTDAGWVVGYNFTASQFDNGYLYNTNASNPIGYNVAVFGAQPTATTFTVLNQAAGSPFVNNTNYSGNTYVAYLFASCPGVSKVGNYTGTGATQTISCGFTGGARYVLIKRIDSTGDWWVWDTARGMISGTDPRLAYNSTAVETNANWVYTTTGGFQIVTSDATVNASGGRYIYLAVA